ncbi:alpha/beta hydrolase [Undibacterium flavidum]|uniref:Alpha/beta hydrolase n=1 Tax=Undibacterium flavidum TaxID=2762297 RepID=A0ABR6YDV7_9BURK|nr:alpha/beta hydrolase [Undibacterium flavidum]MBC3874699.1 alpha/beta hydrolase [Undibacterium flavidum]
MSLSTLLSGCFSMRIVDSDILHPDKSSGYQQKQKFDALVLKQVRPEASFSESSIVINETLHANGFAIEQTHADVLVLYLGGADSHIDNAAKYLMQTIGSCPINLQMYDYRGYGRTVGEPTMDNLKRDALKIYDDLKSKSSKKLVIHGYSLGSFIAAHIAQQRQVDGIILEATGSSFMALLDAKVPAFAKPFFHFEAADSLRVIKVDRDMARYHGKALVIAGEKDDQTPPALGRLVFDAIPGSEKHFIVAPNVGHSGLLRNEDVRKTYCEFITQIQASRSQ